MLALAAAFALAVPPPIEPEPAPVRYPARQLRCIHKEMPRAARDDVARRFWSMQESPHDIGIAVAALQGTAINTCRLRHDWGGRATMLAQNYALGIAIRDYARVRLSALHIRTSRLDRLYRALPAADRRDQSSRAANLALGEELTARPAAYATDPHIQEHAAIYLFALGLIERSTDMWEQPLTRD